MRQTNEEELRLRQTAPRRFFPRQTPATMSSLSSATSAHIPSTRSALYSPYFQHLLIP